MISSGYVKALSVSRYNRRLHALASWLEGMLVVLGEVFAKGEAFIIPRDFLRSSTACRCRW
jgi:hypothetical protein